MYHDAEMSSQEEGQAQYKLKMVSYFSKFGKRFWKSLAAQFELTLGNQEGGGIVTNTSRYTCTYHISCSRVLSWPARRKTRIISGTLSYLDVKSGFISAFARVALRMRLPHSCLLIYFPFRWQLAKYQERSYSNIFK